MKKAHLPALFLAEKGGAVPIRQVYDFKQFDTV